jgi:hypothetical protein
MDGSATQQEWCQQTDPTSGRSFYYNNQTGQTQWEQPVSCTDGGNGSSTGEEPDELQRIQQQQRGLLLSKHLERKGNYTADAVKCSKCFSYIPFDELEEVRSSSHLLICSSRI